MDNRPIGIFDSGVGGLSVFLEVTKLLPKESVIYLGDQANSPYGTRSEEELKNLTKKIVEFLIKKDVKMVIIACNTASVYAIDYLRSNFKIPIIGTVPVVKTLVSRTKTGKVAVFSTPGTAKSQYLKDLVKRFAEGKKVYIVGGTRLEALVEKGKIEDPKIVTTINKFLTPLVKRGVDAIALACTHYPFLKTKMEEILGPGVNIYDSGAAIARQTKRILTNNNLVSSAPGPKYTFYTTGEAKKFRKVTKLLLGKSLGLVRHAAI